MQLANINSTQLANIRYKIANTKIQLTNSKFTDADYTATAWTVHNSALRLMPRENRHLLRLNWQANTKGLKITDCRPKQKGPQYNNQNYN